MSPRRSEYIDKAVIAALRDVKLLEAAITAYEFAVRTATQHVPGYHRASTPQDHGDDGLRAVLWRKKAEAQARAMMFGALSTNKALTRAALREASAFIVRDNAEIMSYLTIEGVMPGHWLSNTEHDFREEIRAAVRELLGTEDADPPAEPDLEQVAHDARELAVLRAGRRDVVEELAEAVKARLDEERQLEEETNAAVQRGYEVGLARAALALGVQEAAHPQREGEGALQRWLDEHPEQED